MILVEQNCPFWQFEPFEMSKMLIFEALEEAQIEEIGHFEVLENGNFGHFGHFCSTKIT